MICNRCGAFVEQPNRAHPRDKELYKNDLENWGRYFCSYWREPTEEEQTLYWYEHNKWPGEVKP